MLGYFMVVGGDKYLNKVTNFCSFNAGGNASSAVVGLETLVHNAANA